MEIVLHCSASSYGNAALISKWHTHPPFGVVQRGKKYKGNGWDHIGYHLVILNGWISRSIYNEEFNGHIETGRPFDNNSEIDNEEIGAHVKGYNKNTVGVCFIGRSGHFSDEQLESAYYVIAMLKKQFGQDTKVKQHSDYDPIRKASCAGLSKEQMDDFNEI